MYVSLSIIVQFNLFLKEITNIFVKNQHGSLREKYISPLKKNLSFDKKIPSLHKEEKGYLGEI